MLATEDLYIVRFHIQEHRRRKVLGYTLLAIGSHGGKRGSLWRFPRNNIGLA